LNRYMPRWFQERFNEIGLERGEWRTGNRRTLTGSTWETQYTNSLIRLRYDLKSDKWIVETHPSAIGAPGNKMIRIASATREGRELIVGTDETLDVPRSGVFVTENFEWADEKW
jgi:hypothetical protein